MREYLSLPKTKYQPSYTKSAFFTNKIKTKVYGFGITRSMRIWQKPHESCLGQLMEERLDWALTSTPLSSDERCDEGIMQLSMHVKVLHGVIGEQDP